jgi:hypothetical protein
MLQRCSLKQFWWRIFFGKRREVGSNIFWISSYNKMGHEFSQRYIV